MIDSGLQSSKRTRLGWIMRSRVDRRTANNGSDPFIINPYGVNWNFNVGPNGESGAPVASKGDASKGEKGDNAPNSGMTLHVSITGCQ